MSILGEYIRDVITLNQENRNFRLFSPDEAASNRLSAVFQATGRRWIDPIEPGVDDHLSPNCLLYTSDAADD